MHFELVVSYHTNKNATGFLTIKSSIKIEFVALGETGLHVPITASMGMQVGIMTIVGNASGCSSIFRPKGARIFLDRAHQLEYEGKC